MSTESTTTRPTGRLVLVATPIGNLGDISARAQQALRTADLIVCEDTRHTRKLLNHLDIREVSVRAVHEHNEFAEAPRLVELVQEGKTVALVTDAGMPGISDPGQRVVAAMAEAGCAVSVVPGPSAAPAAVAVSGFVSDRFVFEGFLPQKKQDLDRRLADISSEQRTVVMYEAPHRIAKTVKALAGACSTERRVVLVRELTKLHEEVWRGTLGELRNRLDADSVKGECVLVMEGATAPSSDVDENQLRTALDELRSNGYRTKEAVAEVAERFGVAKNRVYQLATAKE